MNDCGTSQKRNGMRKMVHQSTVWLILFGYPNQLEKKLLVYIKIILFRNKGPSYYIWKDQNDNYLAFAWILVNNNLAVLDTIWTRNDEEFPIPISELVEDMAICELYER
jgi:hypothetical protein